MQIIITAALEAYRRERFLKAVNARYATLREDAAAWARVAEGQISPRTMLAVENVLRFLMRL